MNTVRTEPTYNLKVVVKETGIKPDTVRAWERRYGLPNPDRSPGGHRLYSQRDIETIRWLMARQEEGLSISRAVQLWRTLEEEARDPLQVMPYPAAETSVSVALPTGATVDDARDAWINACLDFDEVVAERILSQAFAVYPPEMVCTAILQKGVSQIGELWYQNKASVQQEHFASALAMRRVHTLLAAAPIASRRERIVVGSAPEELHEFAPLLLAFLLRFQGWDVVYLGANVPFERLDETIEALRPQLFVLTAQQLITAANLLETIHNIEPHRVRIAFGGRIFSQIPSLHERVPAHFLGASLVESVDNIGQLLSMGLADPVVAPIPPSYPRAQIAYAEAEVAMSESVRQKTAKIGLPEEQVAQALLYVTREINAALSLGDMAYLEPDMNWIRGLLSHHGYHSEMLVAFLRTYRQIAEANLREAGQPIIEWLAGAIGNVRT